MNSNFFNNDYLSIFSDMGFVNSVRDKFNQISYGLKIIFKKSEYFNAVYNNNVLPKKLELYRKKLQVYKNKAFNKGRLEGEEDYKRYINQKFSGIVNELGVKSLPENCCLEELIMKINESKLFNKLLPEKPRIYDPLTELCMETIRKNFNPYVGQILKLVKEYSPDIVKKVEVGLLNGLVNYLLLCCNLKSFDGYGLLDTSYAILYREHSSSKTLTFNNLNPNINGLIIPVATIREYYAMINPSRDVRIGRRVKSDIIQLLSDPKLVIVPMSKSIEYLDDDTLNLFCNDEGMQKKYHKADLQIISFYKKFGHQFSLLYLLARDQDLWSEMEKLSKGKNNLRIVFQPNIYNK